MRMAGYHHLEASCDPKERNASNLYPPSCMHGCQSPPMACQGRLQAHRLPLFPNKTYTFPSRRSMRARDKDRVGTSAPGGKGGKGFGSHDMFVVRYYDLEKGGFNTGYRALQLGVIAGVSSSAGTRSQADPQRRSIAAQNLAISQDRPLPGQKFAGEGYADIPMCVRLRIRGLSLAA